MIMPVRHSLSPTLARLLIFGFMPMNDGACGGTTVTVPAADAETVTGADITRARSLLSGFESVGVRFPAEVYGALEQAAAAYEQNRWTLQVDRSFYSVLGLLESVVRLGSPDRAARLGCYDNAPRDADERGWTVIISNRLKVVEGSGEGRCGSQPR